MLELTSGNDSSSAIDPDRAIVRKGRYKSITNKPGLIQIRKELDEI